MDNTKRCGDVVFCPSTSHQQTLKNFFTEQELSEDPVISKMEITARDVKIYSTNFYNIDAIIAVGYHISSKEATQFRIWATKVLREYIVKGFPLHDDMLNNRTAFDQNYFKELLKII